VPRKPLFQPRLAGVQRLRPEVLAIEFQQVEGIVQRLIIAAPTFGWAPLFFVYVASLTERSHQDDF
jgi:hypothetical protein